MNKERREGEFYAAKVRLFLNEYSGISLEEFCKAENVSYNKMCNCLGRPSYRKEDDAPQSFPEMQTTSDADQMELPEMKLKPLVIDMESNCCTYCISTYEYPRDVFRRIGTTANEDMVNLLPYKWQLTNVNSTKFLRKTKKSRRFCRV